MLLNHQLRPEKEQDIIELNENKENILDYYENIPLFTRRYRK